MQVWCGACTASPPTPSITSSPPTARTWYVLKSSFFQYNQNFLISKKSKWNIRISYSNEFHEAILKTKKWGGGDWIPTPPSIVLKIGRWNTLYVLGVLGLKRPQHFTLKKYICTMCPKSAVRGCKQNVLRKIFFIGVSPIKSWEKSRKFRCESSEDFFE